MATRKTFDVSVMLEEANRLLALPDSKTHDANFRHGICSMIEKILMDSGNYHGFGYSEWMNGGYTRWVADGQPADKDQYIGDETRRVYYGSYK